MKSLRKIFEQILREVEPDPSKPDPFGGTSTTGNTGPMPAATPPSPGPMSPTPGVPTVPTGQNQIINFPGDSFSMSLFPSQKKVTLSPSAGSVPSNKIQTVAKEIGDKFNVLSEKDLPNKGIEIKLSPSESFTKFSQWVQEYIEQNRD